MTALTGTVVRAAKNGGLGEEHTGKGSYTLGGAIASGDTITFSGILGKGEKRIIGFRYYGIELDTNASPTATLIAGSEGDDNGFLTSKTAGGAIIGQLIFFGDGALIDTITDDENVILTVGGTVATAASDGTLYVEVVTEGV